MIKNAREAQLLRPAVISNAVRTVGLFLLSPVRLMSLLVMSWFLAATAVHASSALAGPSTNKAVIVPTPPKPQRRAMARFAAHNGFDRLVFSGAYKVDVTPATDRLSLAVKLSPVAAIDTIAHCGKRLIAVIGGAEAGTVSLAAGVQVRIWHNKGLFVIDVLDPIKPAGLAVQERLAAPPPPASQAMAGKHQGASDQGKRADTESEKSIGDTVTIGAENKSAHYATTTMEGAAPQLALSSPGQNETVPVSGHGAVTILSEAEMPGPAILLSVDNKTGAAAFIRNGTAHIVLDQSQAMDLSPLKDDPAFGDITQTMLPTGTDLSFPVPQTAQLHLVKYRGNWAASLSRSIPPAAPVAGHMRVGVLVFDLNSPGRVVVLEDQVTGGRLLVGTQRQGEQRVVNQHTAAEMTIVPTWQGVVVEPTSDRVALRATRDGYEILTAESPALSISWPEQTLGTWPDGRTMTRTFDFPDLSAKELHRRLTQAVQDAASLPKAARFAARLRVAQAMLAEGSDVEAAAVLRTAVADDPRRRDDPLAAGLSAVAAWLFAEAGGVPPHSLPSDLAALGGSDEATMWRALLSPDQPEMARQSAALASTWPLLRRYPPNLRRLILRPAAALLAKGGQDRALTAFLAAFPETSLDVSRARMLQMTGKTAESLALLDAVTRRSDRLARAEALELAVDERLSAGQLTPQEAADKIERVSYSWRGDERELHLRRRLAQLHAQAGSWRAALKDLEGAEAIFPDDQAAIQTDQLNIIGTALNSDQAAKLTALDLVGLAAKAAALPSDLDQVRLAPMLAEKLLALDLPDQAEPIIQNLFAKEKDPRSKAEIGLKLAELKAGGGDPNAALAVLDECNSPNLTPAATESRVLLRARLFASLGRASEALATLSGQPGHRAREAEVAIMEGQRDWVGAANTLDRTIEDSGFAALPDEAQRELILHAARDRSEAGDVAGLRQLHKTYAAKFQAGRNSALFAVLTADPVQNTADLPRSAKEIAALHSLPVSLSRAAP